MLFHATYVKKRWVVKKKYITELKNGVYVKSVVITRAYVVVFNCSVDYLRVSFIWFFIFNLFMFFKLWEVMMPGGGFIIFLVVMWLAYIIL